MWYIVAILFIASIVLFFRQSKKITTSSSNQFEMEYRLVPSLLSNAEKRFLSTLDDAVRTRARVFCMVRVADVIKPAGSLDKKLKHALFRKTSQKHFDFVICEPISLKPLCIIELNDKSHQRKDRQERDVFLKSACDSAGLPLQFIPVTNTYDVAAISSYVDQYLPVELKKVG